ncbi:MAG: YggS family pyridoxal phosphate-dependent enzyme [Chloroflexi bacterium]|nr:YggS family pyridoxal phosphate-dependent enzyme [Chloroflexota bacterium]
MNDLEKNLRAVQARIHAAAESVRRDPNGITLVAVSKTFSAENIIAAYELGVRHFGENRVEEAQAKIQKVKNQNPSAAITWHLVGHLQRRKTRDAVELFDVIHSVDSVALAQKINQRLAANKRIAILLEVNISGEQSKSGFAPEPRADFFAAVKEILNCQNLDAQGLMTIAPIVAQPPDARPYFRALRELRDELREKFPHCAWQHLSMGMTDDFEAAIAEGATMLRIGRAIFGERT